MNNAVVNRIQQEQELNHLASLEHEKKTLLDMIAEIDRRIFALKTRGVVIPGDRNFRRPGITDHAVIRYLERYRHIDPVAVRVEMMSHGLEQAILRGEAAFVDDRGQFAISGRSVTTFYPHHKK